MAASHVGEIRWRSGDSHASTSKEKCRIAKKAPRGRVHEGHRFEDPEHVRDLMLRMLGWFDDHMPSSETR
jgi:hypothetical protein